VKVQALMLTVAVLWGAAQSGARAAGVVPFDVQVPLLLKALTYDRSLKGRVGDQVRIAVALPAKAGREAAELRAALDGLPDRTLNGLPVSFKEVAGDEAALGEALRGGRWAVVYVMPGFSAAEIEAIKRVCAARQVLAAAAQVDDVERGIAFGVGVQGGKPQLVVNLGSMKAFGSQFDLALLQLARVIQ
jgi:hypothetical protein